MKDNLLLYNLSMKIQALSLLFITILLFSCNKSEPAPIPVEKEATIAFTLNVNPGTGNILAVVGASQVINVKLGSTMPVGGVNIDLNVTKDLDNTSVFKSSISSVTIDNYFTITGLNPGVLCTANIVVTSKATPANSKTFSFKLAAK